MCCSVTHTLLTCHLCSFARTIDPDAQSLLYTSVVEKLPKIILQSRSNFSAYFESLSNFSAYFESLSNSLRILRGVVIFLCILLYRLFYHV
jgi:hypothetical protein